MATYTLTTAVNADTLATKTGGDTYNINGTSASVTFDQHTRYGVEQNTSAILGAINPSASLGGKVIFEGRYLRLIPYDTGSGNVPAAGTAITQGSASGVLIGVYDSLTVAPTTAGSAMPADGFILIRQWNGTYYAAGALTGLGANATGQDVVGWMEQVGQESTGITLSRLNNNSTHLIRGAWYKVGTTGGSRTDTYQIPTNGVDQYHSGVMVGKAAPVSIASASWSGGVMTVNTTGAHGFTTGDEIIIEGALPYAYTSEVSELEPITVVDSDTFTMPRVANPGTYTSGGTAVAVEWYPITSSSALVATVGTEAVRGKYCWITPSTGILRFGHDGTNLTGGFLPASGIPIYMPNVFLQNATSGAKTVNSLNATVSSRYSISTTAAGELIIDRATGAWRMNNLNTPSVIEIRNTSMYTHLAITTNANPAVLDTICVSNNTTHTNAPLGFTNSPQGGTISDSVFAAPVFTGANQSIFLPSSSSNFEFTRSRFLATGAKAFTSNYAINGTTADNLTFTDCTFTVGVWLFNQSSAIEITRPIWVGASGGKTEIANANTLINIISKTTNVTIDGLSFGGLTGVMPRNYLATVTTGSGDVTIKNIGEYATPIDAGADGQTDTVTARNTPSPGTTCTVTHVAHGYVTGDTIVVDKTDTAGVPVGVKTITVTGVDTFTFACTNTGTATPKISYYLSYMQGVLTAAVGVVGVTTQNVNFTYTREAPYVTTTSNKNFVFQNFITEPRNPTPPTRLGTNITENSCMVSSGANTASSAVYGTIFLDNFIRDITSPNPTGVSWTRSGTTVTVVSAGHNLSTGDVIQVSGSTVPAGALNGLTAITVIDSGSFTYTGVASGTASGTLNYRVSDSRFSILMNESNTETTNYYTIGSSSAGLTGSGTLSQPTIGDNRTWTTPSYIKGYNSFPNILPTIIGLSNAQALAFDLTYDLDVGSGYSGSFKNLAYQRAGAGGSAASTTVTMTSTTGVAVDDYIYGTGIADGAQVDSITNGTTIESTIANTDAVSGTLTFNQLPNTATLPADGFKIKVKLETVATNTTPITAINIPMTSTNTTRARLYPQAVDSYALTITANVGDTVKLFLTADDSIIQEEVITGDPFVYEYVHDGTNIAAYYVVVSDDYQVIKEDITLIAADQSLVLGFVPDLVWDSTADETRYDVQFANELIVMETGETQYDVRGAYTTWKNLLRVSDNGKYDLAYTVEGGKVYSTPKQIPYLTGLINGWKIRPDEADHTLTVENGILYVDGGGDPFVDTLGAYTVRIPYAAPVEVLTVSTGSGVLPSDITDIVDAVWDEPTASHATAGTTGKKLADIPTTTYTVPTVGEVVDGVWDEPLSGHATAGTTGKAIIDIEVDAAAAAAGGAESDYYSVGDYSTPL